MGLAIIGATVLATDGLAEEHGQMVLLPAGSAVAWQAGPADLPKGTQIAVLAGDPGKPGPFVLRVKFPPNTTVAPHRHATAENLTILTGDVYHGMGETLDRQHGERLAPGGFVFLPGMMPHSVWTTSAEAIVQVTGTGPFGLLYVNPADDPSKAR
ncbi:cupin domain-containing protein [Roseicella frigidaeris]|uniref:Cupin n=1 Tax=Roseicella frigidaeris TaxID=2230885 RepID=A0A327M4Q9_9PROT|nr:cupin domain-containing protein [Roseicella frigidaeris]RAI57970.1 cupin [Roseicella frigidaeris]